MYFIGFFFRRLSQGVLIIFLVSLLIFTLLRVVPGDPTRLLSRIWPLCFTLIGAVLILYRET